MTKINYTPSKLGVEETKSKAKSKIQRKAFEERHFYYNDYSPPPLKNGQWLPPDSIPLKRKYISGRRLSTPSTSSEDFTWRNECGECGRPYPNDGRWVKQKLHRRVKKKKDKFTQITLAPLPFHQGMSTGANTRNIMNRFKNALPFSNKRNLPRGYKPLTAQSRKPNYYEGTQYTYKPTKPRLQIPVQKPTLRGNYRKALGLPTKPSAKIGVAKLSSRARLRPRHPGLLTNNAPFKYTASGALARNAPLKNTPSGLGPNKAPLKTTPSGVGPNKAPLKTTPSGVLAPLKGTPSGVLANNAPLKGTQADILANNAPLKNTASVLLDNNTPLKNATPGVLANKDGTCEFCRKKLLPADKNLDSKGQLKPATSTNRVCVQPGCPNNQTVPPCTSPVCPNNPALVPQLMGIYQEVVSPPPGQLSKPYDRNGQLSKPYDRNGRLSKPYDRNGQLSKPYDRNGQLSKPYDRNGQLSKPYDRNGQLSKPYDRNGQLSKPYDRKGLRSDVSVKPVVCVKCHKKKHNKHAKKNKKKTSNDKNYSNANHSLHKRQRHSHVNVNGNRVRSLQSMSAIVIDAMPNSKTKFNQRNQNAVQEKMNSHSELDLIDENNDVSVSSVEIELFGETMKDKGQSNSNIGSKTGEWADWNEHTEDSIYARQKNKMKNSGSLLMSSLKSDAVYAIDVFLKTIGNFTTHQCQEKIDPKLTLNKCEGGWEPANRIKRGLKADARLARNRLLGVALPEYDTCQVSNYREKTLQDCSFEGTKLEQNIANIVRDAETAKDYVTQVFTKAIGAKRCCGDDLYCCLSAKEKSEGYESFAQQISGAYERTKCAFSNAIYGPNCKDCYGTDQPCPQHHSHVESCSGVVDPYYPKNRDVMVQFEDPTVEFNEQYPGRKRSTQNIKYPARESSDVNNSSNYPGCNSCTRENIPLNGNNPPDTPKSTPKLESHGQNFIAAKHHEYRSGKNISNPNMKLSFNIESLEREISSTSISSTEIGLSSGNESLTENKTVRTKINKNFHNSIRRKSSKKSVKLSKQQDILSLNSSINGKVRSKGSPVSNQPNDITTTCMPSPGPTERRVRSPINSCGGEQLTMIIPNRSDNTSYNTNLNSCHAFDFPDKANGQHVYQTIGKPTPRPSLPVRGNAEQSNPCEMVYVPVARTYSKDPGSQYPHGNYLHPEIQFPHGNYPDLERRWYPDPRMGLMWRLTNNLRKLGINEPYPCTRLKRLIKRVIDAYLNFYHNLLRPRGVDVQAQSMNVNNYTSGETNCIPTEPSGRYPPWESTNGNAIEHERIELMLPHARRRSIPATDEVKDKASVKSDPVLASSSMGYSNKKNRHHRKRKVRRSLKQRGRMETQYSSDSDLDDERKNVKRRIRRKKNMSPNNKRLPVNVTSRNGNSSNYLSDKESPASPCNSKTSGQGILGGYGDSNRAHIGTNGPELSSLTGSSMTSNHLYRENRSPHNMVSGLAGSSIYDASSVNKSHNALRQDSSDSFEGYSSSDEATTSCCMGLSRHSRKQSKISLSFSNDSSLSRVITNIDDSAQCNLGGFSLNVDTQTSQLYCASKAESSSINKKLTLAESSGRNKKLTIAESSGKSKKLTNAIIESEEPTPDDNDKEVILEKKPLSLPDTVELQKSQTQIKPHKSVSHDIDSDSEAKVTEIIAQKSKVKRKAILKLLDGVIKEMSEYDDELPKAKDPYKKHLKTCNPRQCNSKSDDVRSTRTKAPNEKPDQDGDQAKGIRRNIKEFDDDANHSKILVNIGPSKRGGYQHHSHKHHSRKETTPSQSPRPGTRNQTQQRSYPLDRRRVSFFKTTMQSNPVAMSVNEGAAKLLGRLQNLRPNTKTKWRKRKRKRTPRKNNVTNQQPSPNSVQAAYGGFTAQPGDYSFKWMNNGTQGYGEHTMNPDGQHGYYTPTDDGGHQYNYVSKTYPISFTNNAHPPRRNRLMSFLRARMKRETSPDPSAHWNGGSEYADQEMPGESLSEMYASLCENHSHALPPTVEQGGIDEVADQYMQKQYNKNDRGFCFTQVDPVEVHNAPCNHRNKTRYHRHSKGFMYNQEEASDGAVANMRINRRRYDNSATSSQNSSSRSSNSARNISPISNYMFVK